MFEGVISSLVVHSFLHKTLIIDCQSHLVHWDKPPLGKQTWVQPLESRHSIHFLCFPVGQKPLLHTHQTGDEHCQTCRLEKGFSLLWIACKCWSNQRSLHHWCRTSLGAAWQTYVQCIRTTVNPEAVAQEIKRGGRAGAFFALGISLWVLRFRWWHTSCAHGLRVLCLPPCFRILHHGVTSAVLNSLKKQTFHLANSTQTKPHSSSKERAMWIDLQESLGNASWARVHLACSSPYLLRGTAQFHWSSFEQGGAMPAP